jgi:hypothetical protein
MFRTVKALFLLLITGVSVALSQTERRGTMSLVEGRRYVVAFPQVWASNSEEPLPQPMQLWISSKVKATVRIETPAAVNDQSRISRTITLQPNKVEKVSISRAYMNEMSERKSGYGIQVTADKPISVSTYQAWNGNGELARHLPVEAWGKNYFTMNFYQDRYGTSANGGGPFYRPSQILIVADKDNTMVTYSPTVTTEGGTDMPSTVKGSSNTVELMRGETFLIKSKIDENQNKEFTTDLSGTWVRANKPVGVISGHTKVAIMRYPDVLPPTGNFAAPAHFVRNNVHDAMLPWEMAGQEFVTVPIKYTPTRVVGQASVEFGIDDDKGDVIRFVALEDNTVVSEVRQDGTLKNLRTLRKGESALVTSQEYAAVWRSNKPMLMGQYGKSYAKILPPMGVKRGDVTQGHPTVESGMPMLQYVPSTDRWVNYGVFHSPEGMDNFFNIVFKLENVSKIKVDGATLSSRYGGQLRELKGTPYGYIAASLSAGDHVIESVSEDIKWVAWNYGSLDGLQMGRAYGTPIAIDLTIPCDDSLAVTDQIVCGDVTGEGKIVPENSTCGSIFAVYAEEEENYSLVINPNFSSGDKTVNFQVLVLDKTKDARATIRVITRSGKYVERTYTYIADKLAWDPASIDFGTIPFGTPVTRQITFTNQNTDRDLLVKKLKVKKFATTFMFNPSTFVLKPGESKVVDVTATITTAEQKKDTVIAELECFDVPTTELKVRGDEPKIFVDDKNWGQLPINDAREESVRINNRGSVDLVVTGYDEAIVASQNNFYDFKAADGRPLNTAFPITLKKGEYYEFKVTYSPRGSATGHTLIVDFYSNAQRDQFKGWSELKGEGIVASLSASPFDWKERVIDTWQTTQGINAYNGQVTIKNVGNSAVSFTNVTIIGADAGYFRFTGPVLQSAGGPVPDQIAPDGKIYTIPVQFIPSEVANTRDAERAYDVKVRFEANGPSGDASVEAALTGEAYQPHVTATGYDWTVDANGSPMSYIVGETAKGTVVITNQHGTLANAITGDTKGSMNLTITDIRIDPSNPKAQHFSIDPTWTNKPTAANPAVIAGGDYIEVPVIFNPRAAGLHEVPYLINDDAPENPTPMLRGMAEIQGNFTVTGFKVISWYSKSVEAAVTVTATYDTRINIGQISGADALSFEKISPLEDYIDIKAGETKQVIYRFTAGAVTQEGLTNGQNLNGRLPFRASNFTAQVTFDDPAMPENTGTANLEGVGKYLETTVAVGSTNSNTPGKSTVVPFVLKAAPEAIDAAGLTQMKIWVSFDKSIVKPRLDEIDLTGTQLEGWTILEARFEEGNGSFVMQLRDKRATQVGMVQSDKPLFNVTFDLFLGDKQESDIKIEGAIPFIDFEDVSDAEEKRYVVMNDEDGKIKIDLECAKELRIIDLGAYNYAIESPKPNPATSTTVINYSIGLNAHTRIALYNQMGEFVTDIINQAQSAGKYAIDLDLTTIPSGVYYYRVISGPYSSEPQQLHIVK